MLYKVLFGRDYGGFRSFSSVILRSFCDRFWWFLLVLLSIIPEVAFRYVFEIIHRHRVARRLATSIDVFPVLILAMTFLTLICLTKTCDCFCAWVFFRALACPIVRKSGRGTFSGYARPRVSCRYHDFLRRILDVFGKRITRYDCASNQCVFLCRQTILCLVRACRLFFLEHFSDVLQLGHVLQHPAE